MKHGSLFSGIGGFDLAAEWMGWTNMFHCEWNEFGQKILKYYWPNAKSYSDIKKSDFNEWKGQIDILTGGFPCQPFSAAGKRKGTEDERHLWPQMLRAIQEIQPRWIVGENVYGILNWSGGLVFDQVCADLEAERYEVQPVILPAAGVNAPHKRDRVWFIAHSIDSGHKAERKKKRKKDGISKEHRTAMGSGIVDGANLRSISADSRLLGQKERQEQPMGVYKLCEERNVADSKIVGGRSQLQQRQRKGEFRGCNSSDDSKPNHKGLEGGEINGSIKKGRQDRNKQPSRFIRSTWQNFPTQPPICGRDDGISRELDGITFPKWRNESIKGYGNAIVPQVAFEIFKAINEIQP